MICLASILAAGCTLSLKVNSSSGLQNSIVNPSVNSRKNAHVNYRLNPSIKSSVNTCADTVTRGCPFAHLKKRQHNKYMQSGAVNAESTHIQLHSRRYAVVFNLS